MPGACQGSHFAIMAWFLWPGRFHLKYSYIKLKGLISSFQNVLTFNHRPIWQLKFCKIFVSSLCSPSLHNLRTSAFKMKFLKNVDVWFIAIPASFFWPVWFYVRLSYFKLKATFRAVHWCHIACFRKIWLLIFWQKVIFTVCLTGPAFLHNKSEMSFIWQPVLMPPLHHSRQVMHHLTAYDLRFAMDLFTCPHTQQVPAIYHLIMPLFWPV